VQFWYCMTGNFSLPPPPRHQHFRENFFRCHFQYPKVPLEAGAPPIFWCFLRPWMRQWRNLGLNIRGVWSRFVRCPKWVWAEKNVKILGKLKKLLMVRRGSVEDTTLILGPMPRCSSQWTASRAKRTRPLGGMGACSRSY
jgi:hypothetical protein